MKINIRHQKALFILITVIVSFSFGRLSLQYEIRSQVPPLQVVDEINQKIPLVTINNISQGRITGSVNTSEIRISSGEQVAVPADDLSFLLDIQHLGYIGVKRPKVAITIPEWARFVASKNGKYFYELDEKSAKRLSPQNQVYFETGEKAKIAGYKKRER